MIVRTERLLLRPFEDRDRAPFAAINADPETMRYFDRAYSKEDTDAAIARYRNGLAANGYGFLAAELLATGEIVGVIGLSRFGTTDRYVPGNPEAEVGWRLRRDLWGQGLAPEGARACLTYAWDNFDLPEIVAITATSNAPSRRVMEKIGMTHDPQGDFVHPKVDPASPLRHHVTYRVANPRRG